MQSTVKYCLLRLYLSSNSSMGKTEQNGTIKFHMRRSAIHSQDPDEDSWSSKSIYAPA
jgi:hypothetical protein